MVRHNVENLTELVSAERGAERRMPFGAAQFMVYLLMVDDVVSMGATANGLQIGRTIQMADAERGEIVNGGCGIGKTKAGVKLHSVRGAKIFWHVDTFPDLRVRV
jgi:hypothetical protein